MEGGLELIVATMWTERPVKVLSDLCRGPHAQHVVHPAERDQDHAIVGVYWLGDQANEHCNGCAALRGRRRRRSRHTRRFSKKPKGEIIADWEQNSICSPSPRTSAPACRLPPQVGRASRHGGLSRTRHEEAGYEFVIPVHHQKSTFEKSGHLDWYAEAMYPPMHLDAVDAEGQVRRQGADYYPSL